MALSSITHNFVITNKRDANRFARAIDKSFQKSLVENDATSNQEAIQITDPEEMLRLLTHK